MGKPRVRSPFLAFCFTFIYINKLFAALRFFPYSRECNISSISATSTLHHDSGKYLVNHVILVKDLVRKKSEYGLILMKILAVKFRYKS